MSNRQIGPVAKELIRARAFLADPENWCRGHSRIGRRRCALGAIRDMSLDGYAYLDSIARNALDASAVALFPDSNGHPDRPAAVVNDRDGHAAVLQVYDHAISAALKEGK
jgi:hypothetical protein